MLSERSMHLVVAVAVAVAVAVVVCAWFAAEDVEVAFVP